MYATEVDSNVSGIKKTLNESGSYLKNYYTQTKKAVEEYIKPSNNNSNSTYDYSKRYDVFRNDEEEETKLPTRTFKNNKNLSIHDDSKMTQRDDEDEYSHHELGASRRHAAKPEPVKEVKRNEEEDSEEDIGLPKNPFANNSLPIPFTARIDPEDKSDLRGWEAGQQDEDEEIDSEKLKKAKRPLVSHFRDFPTEPRNKDYLAYLEKASRDKYDGEDDEEEEDSGLGSWENTENRRAKVSNDVIGVKKGNNEVKIQFAGNFTTPEFPRAKVPEKKPAQIHRDFEEDELSGWAC